MEIHIGNKKLKKYRQWRWHYAWFSDDLTGIIVVSEK